MIIVAHTSIRFHSRIEVFFWYTQKT
jgi:hypothetical protein